MAEEKPASALQSHHQSCEPACGLSDTASPPQTSNLYPPSDDHHLSLTKPHPSSSQPPVSVETSHHGSSGICHTLFEPDSGLPSRCHSAPTGDAFGRDNPQLAQSRLHELLSSYTTPLPAHNKGGSEEQRSRMRVKFKPAVPSFSHHEQVRDQPNSAFSHSHHRSQTGQHHYRSLSAQVGPHPWPACPQRSPSRERSDSASRLSSKPSAQCVRQRPLSPHHHSCTADRVTLDALNIDALNPALLHQQGVSPGKLNSPHKLRPPADVRPPFVVRHADPRLLERREFCGHSYSTASQRDSGSSLQQADEAPNICVGEVDSAMKGGVIHSRDVAKNALSSASTEGSAVDASQRAHEFYPLVPQPPPPPPPAAAASHPDHTTPVQLARTHSDLVSKYLVSDSGSLQSSRTNNGGDGRGGSAFQLIEEKLVRLRQECCACRVSDGRG